MASTGPASRSSPSHWASSWAASCGPGSLRGWLTIVAALAAFAIALTATGSLDATAETVAPLGGYLTVWAVCAGASFLAALALMAAPPHAFSDTREVLEDALAR